LAPNRHSGPFRFVCLMPQFLRDLAIFTYEPLVGGWITSQDLGLVLTAIGHLPQRIRLSSQNQRLFG
jgi:hypothetical protein